MQHKTIVNKDPKKKAVTISREFDAPMEVVWHAYTDKDLLKKWWSPAPWKLEVKEMDFREGGDWIYAMVGPEGEKHWSKTTYRKIETLRKMELEDCFCDENGKINRKMPASQATVTFSKTDRGTNVDYLMTFETPDAYKQTLDMGFEQGMTQCLEQLDNLLKDSR